MRNNTGISGQKMVLLVVSALGFLPTIAAFNLPQSAQAAPSAAIYQAGEANSPPSSSYRGSGRRK
jgi:hypothetical protein